MLARNIVIIILVHGFGLSLLLSGSACNAGEEPLVDYSNCRYEKPEAIFYDGLPQISDHQFVINESGSEEHFVLSQAVRVTILQSGCDYRTQKFIFELDTKEPCEASESCTVQVGKLLQSLSRLGPEYQVFRAWGQAIKEIAPQISFGKSAQLAEGFWIKIDRQKSAGRTSLMLTLSEKP